MESSSNNNSGGGGGGDGSSSDTVVVLWVLSYPGRREEWEGKFTGAHEVVTEEYSESSTSRESLLDFVISKVADRFTAPPGITQLIAATDKERLFGPRQVYSVTAEDVRALLAHPPTTRVYLLGDAGEYKWLE